jgi:hypothetical protein
MSDLREIRERDPNKRNVPVGQLIEDRATLLSLLDEAAVALREIEGKCPEMQSIMRTHGLKIDNLDDPMQKLAFTFYSEIAQMSEESRALLARIGGTDGR